ncbi:histidinol phosphate phosphatase domain-containing protein [Deltaproteobacteria bacterium OttesenSCG-928-K17]|nr:histidinol phosphate phosphatase domain-containing protein [Deltaproteobacteria bacterium OttesenSCG-928-K17]
MNIANCPPVIDFHTHCLLSDGVLCPAEHARRVEVSGYAVVGLADHADPGTMPGIIAAGRASALALNGHMEVRLLPGVELTHVPPSLIADEVKRARDLGATHVVVHGESVVEPVAPGTNLAAIKAGADILAHPGLLTDGEAALAAEKGVYLELSGRGGHNITNGLIAVLAKKHGAGILVNSDAHAPGDWLTPLRQKQVALGAGLSEDDYEKMMKDAARLAEIFFARLGGK